MMHSTAPAIRSPAAAQSPCRSRFHCSAFSSNAQPGGIRRRKLLASTLLPGLYAAGAKAAGLDSLQLPFLANAREGTEAARRKMAEEAAAFESSEFLKGLRERSEANREKNKKDIFNKYCQRQAEMGVGDCAGLRLIPGMTKSGIQVEGEKTPERRFLEFIMGSQGDQK